MKKIIHNLRQQPEEVRRNILHLVMIVCGTVLVFLWFYSLGNTITNEDKQDMAKEDLKPFSALKDNIVGGYNSMSDSTFNTTQ